MIDTETLGRTPGSVVRSVAAIEFDPQTGETGRRKVWKIDLADSIRYGFRIEASTLKWFTLGYYIFWFGFVAYMLLLALVTYRYLHHPIPEAAKPLICIYTAPMSLSLAG